MTNFINLLPIAVVALGALVTLASEPFIRDENKHKIRNQYGGPYGFVESAEPEHHLQRAQERGLRRLNQLLGIGGA